MRLYKAYKLQDVLDEYAISFFTMLEQGYRLEFEQYKMWVNIVSAPHMKDQDRKDFIRLLTDAATDISDILKTDADDYSGLEDLKKMFGQK